MTEWLSLHLQATNSKLIDFLTVLTFLLSKKSWFYRLFFYQTGRQRVLELALTACCYRVSQEVLVAVIKSALVNARDTRDGIWSVGQEGPREEGLATHSSILVWRIPWTEELGGLQSRSDLAHSHTRVVMWFLYSVKVATESGCQQWFYSTGDTQFEVVLNLKIVFPFPFWSQSGL